MGATLRNAKQSLPSTPSDSAIQAFRRLRSSHHRCPAPKADEAAYTPHDVVQIIRHQAADVINIKIAKAGGLYQSNRIAAVAEAAGLECVIGTAWGLGIKVAAKLHLAAATRSLRDGVEFTELMLHDLLLAGPQAADLAPPVTEGYLNVPLGPGFGVTLDEHKVGAHELPKHH